MMPWRNGQVTDRPASGVVDHGCSGVASPLPCGALRRAW